MPSPRDNDSDVIKPRRLILCFDGTSNQYDNYNTNIVKFYSLLEKDRPQDQIMYYQAGIGTYFNPGIISPLFEWVAKILDEAFAWYLDTHVREGYLFLMQNYRAGDKICLFGFSRGAYTARALAGLLYKIGVLPKDNQEQIPFAYHLYTRTDAPGLELSRGFKETFCRSVTVEFVGVWDTVASVGVVIGHNLPFTTSNAAIKVFRHALSLDEHRAKFQPNMYHRTSPDDSSAALDPDRRKSRFRFLRKSPSNLFAAKKFGKDNMKKITFQTKKLAKDKEQTPGASQPDPASPPQVPDECDVLEVFFAGCHADIGGGSVDNSVVQNLANVPLRWMIDQVVKSQCGILFNPDALRREGLDALTISKAEIALKTAVNTTTQNGNGIGYKNDVTFQSSFAAKNAPALNSTDNNGKPGTDVDTLMPIYDQLVLNKAWWILEVLPMVYSYQDADGRWHRQWKFNLGKGRVIREEHPHFHASVKERMADAELKYAPKAQWANGTEVYVD